MEASRTNPDFLRVLNSVLAQWTSPDFITSVAARVGVKLDPGSITALSILGAHGPQRPSSLATRMVTGASNISKIATRLQDAGLLRKLEDPHDSRASLLVLTEDGQRAATALGDSGHLLLNDLLGGWSATDKENLLQLLSRFERETRRVAAKLKEN